MFPGVAGGFLYEIMLTLRNVNSNLGSSEVSVCVVRTLLIGWTRGQKYWGQSEKVEDLFKDISQNQLVSLQCIAKLAEL